MIFNNQENEEYFCVYLDSYHPYWMDRANGIRNSGFNGFSSRILDLKQGDWEAINYFYNEVSPIINNGIAIAIVPSHDPAKKTSGLRVLASLLASDNRIDATECLVRHTKISKLAYGGNRNVGSHLSSIVVKKPELIKGRKVLILDDVYTTGNSLRACKQLIENAGARKVRCLTLSKTV